MIAGQDPDLPSAPLECLDRLAGVLTNRITESGRREIASSTSAIQAREVSRPLGSGMYDVGLGLPPVGMNYAK